MSTFGIALACWFGGALGGFLFRRHEFSAPLGAAAAAVGGVAAAFSAVTLLTSRAPETWSIPWSVPGVALALRLDALSAAFLLPLAAIGAFCAVYGLAYLRRHGHGGPHWSSFAAYNLLLASMATVVAANNLLLLLISWELMTLTSWLLVVSEHEQRDVRGAGLQYLVAGHLATAALLLFTLFLSAGSGSFEIASLSGQATVSSDLLFVLALIGFGTKAGIVPMHVWLPDAHPAAPSHVSALMSAVMVTMGFYGLARFIPLLGTPALWWGYFLMLLGAAGAAGGILFAIAQRDVKRVLAYSTVENMGIATLALGLGLVGTALGRPGLAGIGWTAALLHLWNHALAKSTLFLGFGAIAQGIGSRDLDRMGGLLRRWRFLGGLLLIGAASLAALPGLNVFTSEWLLLYGLLAGGTEVRGVAQVMMFGGLAVLGFVGGLAVVCFTRLAGIGLLGTPRSAGAASAPEPGWAMRIPILALAAAAVLMAMAPGPVAGVLGGAVSVIDPTAEIRVLQAALRPLAILPLLLAAITALMLASRGTLRSRPLPTQTETWGCGFSSPTPAMQYTSTSFSEPLTRILQPVLRSEVDSETSGLPNGALWEPSTRRSTRTLDRILVGFYQPLFATIERGGAALRAFQRPRVTVSLLYIVATVLALLALLFLPIADG